MHHSHSNPASAWNAFLEFYGYDESHMANTNWVYTHQALIFIAHCQGSLLKRIHIIPVFHVFVLTTMIIINYMWQGIMINFCFIFQGSCSIGQFRYLLTGNCVSECPCGTYGDSNTGQCSSISGMFVVSTEMYIDTQEIP